MWFEDFEVSWESIERVLLLLARIASRFWI